MVDFDISENAVILRLDNGEVWWSGMKLIYRPERLMVDGKEPIELIGACRNSLVTVAGDRVRYRLCRYNTEGILCL